MKKQTIIAALFAAVVMSAALGAAYARGAGEKDGGEMEYADTALSTAFSYQGSLKSEGVPVGAACDFQFCLYDAPSLGGQVGITLAQTISVTNGLFSTSLDFGDVYTGTALWLDIKVKCPGDAGYTDLGRQALAASPYARYAAEAGLLDGLDSTDFWSLNGNAGTDESTHYIGTADSQDLVFKTYGIEAMRIRNNRKVTIGDVQDSYLSSILTIRGGENLSGLSVNGGPGGLAGSSTDGVGVRGYSVNEAGVEGESENYYGMYAVSIWNVGLRAYSENGDGVEGSSIQATGVYGHSTLDDGVYGHSANNDGVTGRSANSKGVRGDGDTYDFYASGPGTNYGPFTGAHEVILGTDFPANARAGLIVSVTGEACTRFDDEGAISFSSTLPTVRLSGIPNDPSVLGVFILESPLDEEHWYVPGEGERFGIVNALGEGRVWVTDISGPVQAGDYITTSMIPGYGQKQADDLLHAYTLGKAIETVDWEAVTETIEFGGRVYKVYPLAVVYTGG